VGSGAGVPRGTEFFSSVAYWRGNSTQNIHTLSKIVESVQESGDDALRSLTINVNGGQAAIAISAPQPKTKEENE
jgi:hypothetical protein